MMVNLVNKCIQCIYYRFIHIKVVLSSKKSVSISMKFSLVLPKNMVGDCSNLKIKRDSNLSFDFLFVCFIEKIGLQKRIGTFDGFFET